MDFTLSPKATEFLQNVKDKHLDLLRELAQIPAPSHFEDKRVEFIKNYFLNLGKEVIIDDAKNVILEFNAENSKEISIIAAHTDVVFPDLDILLLTEDDEKIYCPGVCDDTANVVALMLMAEYIIKNNITAKKGFVIVFDSCEEGLGNLKGAKALYERYKGRVKDFVSLDGGFGNVCIGAVGSHRYKVEVKTKGGHSYGNFGEENAIKVLSHLISDLYTIAVPNEGKTTYNVGLIEGGTSVNTIAQNASMLYEYRSDNVKGLEFMKEKFEFFINKHKNKGYDISYNVVGDRPCSQQVDENIQLEMAKKVAVIGEKFTNRIYSNGSASTDCNVFLANGVNAICFGVYEGHGAHTRAEWVQKASLPIGLEMLAVYIKDYFNEF